MAPGHLKRLEKIDTAASLERVRGHYESAAACARLFEISERSLFAMLANERGHTARGGKIRRVRDALAEQGVLVYCESEAEAWSARFAARASRLTRCSFCPARPW